MVLIKSEGLARLALLRACWPKAGWAGPGWLGVEGGRPGRPVGWAINSSDDADLLIRLWGNYGI